MDRSIRAYFIIIGLTTTVLVGSQHEHEQELFLRGNSAYERQQWAEALSSYEAIDKKGSSVWYNMGNCFYKKGDTLDAIVCWRRAMPSASFSEQDAIVKNIAVAYEKLGYTNVDSRYTFFEQWAYRLPLFPLQILFLLCWYALWLFPIFRVRGRDSFFYGALFVLLCALLVLGTLLYTNYRLYSYRQGQVVRESAALFAGPHEQYHQVGSVSLADELRIEEKRAGWYKVACGNQYGWIPAAAVVLI